MSTTTTSDMKQNTTSTSSPFVRGVMLDGRRVEHWLESYPIGEEKLDAPLRMRKPKHIVLRLDLFHEDVPDEWIDRVFAVMALCPQHTFQVLTKRSARMQSYLDDMPDAGEGHLLRWASAAARMVDDGDTTIDVVSTGSWPLLSLSSIPISCDSSCDSRTISALASRWLPI